MLEEEPEVCSVCGVGYNSKSTRPDKKTVYLHADGDYCVTRC